MHRDKVMALLAKLDALAEHPGTPAEGEAARRRADAIREKYAPILAPIPMTPVPVPAMYVTFGPRWDAAMRNDGMSTLPIVINGTRVTFE